MSDKSHDAAGESRREFLKKAGRVAWVVPTIQVVNMASAAAGTVSGSVVTTTSTSTTSKPPCQEFATFRFKADWTGSGWKWSGGIGANDCLTSGTPANGADFGGSIVVSGDERKATVTHSLPDCDIVGAAFKAGTACVDGMVATDGSYAMFDAGQGQDISHIEFLARCCVED